MANTTTGKRKTTTTRAKTPETPKAAPETMTMVAYDTHKIPVPTKKTIPDSAMINVKSNVFGKLIFVSKRTGERVEWENCGDIQQVPLSLLRTMKQECIKFFQDQWVILTGFADENEDTFRAADIYEQLYVAQYYKNLVDPSDYVSICSMTVDEINEKVPLMSDGARANLVVALNTYIEKGVLDSMKVIKAFEQALGCELRDPD